jgi:hypothetical protein
VQPILLSGLKHYFQDQDRGAFAIGAPNDTVRELTGKDAEDSETVARRHAALPESRQSLRVRLAVLARFLTVPILPGFNPETYDRAQEQPMPPTPHLALDDAGWAAEPRHRGLSCRGRYVEGSTRLRWRRPHTAQIADTKFTTSSSRKHNHERVI